MPNVSWSMDFLSDVDDCTRECLAIEVDTSLPGAGRRE